MSSRKYFIQTIHEELPRFERVWKALPQDQMEWRPHEKNQSARQILMTMTFEAMMYPIGLRTGIVKVTEHPGPQAKKPDELWPMFNQSMREAVEIIETMSDEDWNSPAKEFMGEQIVLDSTKEGLAWGFLFDLIHHRGQLSVYIRPMGGKVPSIYGPSGDTSL